jgi:two-component system, NarL family, nitrate/nitrite response regulator NarL
VTRETHGRPATPAIRLFIVTARPLFGRALEYSLRSERVRVLGTSGTLEHAIDRIDRRRPDTVIFDMRLPDGGSGLSSLVAAVPAVKVVAVVTPCAEQDLLACARARVAGYVSEDEDLDALSRTVYAVTRGVLQCSPQAAGPVLDLLANLAAAGVLERPGHALTCREREVVRLLDAGLSNKEIARRLSIALPTVKNHVHNILRKLEVDRRTQAIARVRLADEPEA